MLLRSCICLAVLDTALLGCGGRTTCDACSDGGTDAPDDADVVPTSDASTGDVDSTSGCAASDFGDGGIVVYPESAYDGISLQLQADGKFVTTSGDQIFRFDADGTVDQSFGSGGIVTTPPIDSNFGWGFNPMAVRVAASQRLLLMREVAPTTTKGYRSVLYRFESTGTLDATFGGSGLSDELPPNAGVLFYGMTTLSDDSIIGVGLVTDDINVPADLLVAKYTPDGHLDSSFGQAGIIRHDLGGGSFDVAFDAIVDGSGNIVVAGCTTRNLTTHEMVLVRYDASGKPDATFGTLGISDRVPVVYGHECAYLESHNNVFAGLAFGPNGTILLASHTGTSNLARFTTNGKLDPAFGGTGVIHPYVIGGLAVTNDGSALITFGVQGDGGWALPEFAVSRYRVDGTRDDSFGAAGIATIKFPGQFQSFPVEQQLTTGGLLLLGWGNIDPYTNTVNFAKLGCIE